MAEELRAELSDAIAARRDAEAAARTAAEIASRADCALRDAQAEVEALEAQRAAEQRDAIETHAQRLVRAFRAAEDLPMQIAPADGDSAALRAAVGRLKAIEQATASLAAEAADARDMAAYASAVVRALVDQILTIEAHDLAAQLVAATRVAEELRDRLVGLMRVSDTAFLSHIEQNEILDRIDRRKAAVAADPQMIERPNYDSWLDKLAAEQERRWRSYSRALLDNPAAVFGEELPQ
jgi:hypothetical protein